MGPQETEMRRQIAQGWIPDAEYRVFQGGVFARDYCTEITAERDQLRDQLAAERKRKEEERARLDWVEKQMPLTLLRCEGVVWAGDQMATGATLRAAIDAAIDAARKAKL